MSQDINAIRRKHRKCAAKMTDAQARNLLAELRERDEARRENNAINDALHGFDADALGYRINPNL